jgi:hypothetical protein
MGRKKASKKVEQLKGLLKRVPVPTVAHLPWTPLEKAAPLVEMPNDLIFLNSRYQVNIRKYLCPSPFNTCYELSIKTRDKAPLHDWRDLQHIKNELIGPEVEAVELYPAEKRLVDTANQYYIYAFPELETRAGSLEQCFPFGFQERLVSEDPAQGGVQRPFAEEHKPNDLTSGKELERRYNEELVLRSKRVGPKK